MSTQRSQKRSWAKWSGMDPVSTKKARQEQMMKRNKNIIRRMILNEMETKFVDNAAAPATNSATAGVTVALSTIAEGNSSNQRIGKHITYTYIHARILASITSAGTVSDAVFVAGFALDRQPNGALAAFGDMFATATVDAGVALRDAQTRGDRFKVLKQEHVMLSQGGPSGGYIDLFIPLDKMLRGNDRKAEYLGTAATVGSWSTNQIIFYYGHATESANVPTVTVQYSLRLAYKDA